MTRFLVLAAALALTALTAPAEAARSALPGNWLQISVTKGDGHSSDTRGTLLLCNDVPQGHAKAAEACAQLRAARGDIRAIPPKDVLCTLEYAPVTASARGQWNGRPVQYQHTFGNKCQMAAETGDVFALNG
ncbi:SSI family serine proteinase inhibitor [Streptomyces niveiscabiei]|uniref:SSI family serine proteinase inhibitor n=1 Tax=Streptomyces niveiscabiei TaxID=164115 RepID=UPI0029B6B624|nr:SSI family serine proteinase inhibitor [Streptomyces niveiscabiei]MDX3379924.1 SSI family serine proteinase inhibitor [Streptomyces niveiscabiei]